MSGADTKLTLDDALLVGDGKHAMVMTSDGALLEANRVDLGFYTESLSEATVTSGGKWLVNNQLDVGTNGKGALTISDTGEVDATIVFLTKWSAAYPTPLTLANGTLRSDELYVSAGGIVGTGAVFTKGLVADANLLFDAAHGLQQIASIPGQPGVQLSLDHSLPAALGAGYVGTARLRLLKVDRC